MLLLFEFILLLIFVFYLFEGFACFLLLMACFILLGAAVYISPLISGSINEKKMISGPQEIESNESRATSRDFGGNYNSGNPETKAYVSSNVV